LQVRAALGAPGQPAIHGQSGVLCSFGIAVRGDISLHGAWINVNPPLRLCKQIDAIPPESAPNPARASMGCLLAERHQPVTMTKVRAAIIDQLPAAFDCPRVHVNSGHPHYIAPSRGMRVRTAGGV
jgi:lipoate-protein ligase B